MDQHSMDLTKEAEEYRLHKAHTPAARQKAAVAALGTRSRNQEEDGVCCHLYVPSRSTLFMGCTSGLLLLFKPKNEFHAEIVRSELGVAAGGHRGQIFDMLFLAEGDWTGGGGGGGHAQSSHGSSPHALLATASADRTIKLWDVFERDLRCRCVQTLVGHAGSVTSLSFLRGSLVTASTDGSVRVWRSAPERSLLLYPFFECVQELWSVPPPVPNSVLSAGMGMLGVSPEVAAAAHGKKAAPGNSGAGADAGLSGLGSGGAASGSSGNAPVLKACPFVVGRLIRAETQLLFVGDGQGRVYTFTPPQRSVFGSTLQLSASQAPSGPPTSLAAAAGAGGGSVFSFKHSRAGSIGGNAASSLNAHPSRPQSSSSGGPGAATATAAPAAGGSASTLPLHHHRPSGSITSIASALSLASSGACFGATSANLGGGGGSSGSSFEFMRSHKMHALSVSHLLVIPAESLLITLSHDHTVAAHDALTGSGLFAMENPTRARYTAAAWDPLAAELFLADEKGYLQVWNVFVEKCIKCVRIKEGPINSLSIHSAPGGGGGAAAAGGAGAGAAGGSSTKLLLGTSAGVEVWTVSRGVLFNEVKGHDAPVVALVQVESRSVSRVDLAKLGHPDPRGEAAVEAAAAGSAITTRLGLLGKRAAVPSKKGGNRRGGTPQLTSIISQEKHLYSCSLDQSIRAWDCYDMSCLSMVRERRSEFACMLHLPDSVILVTGHDDGAVRMWNMDSGTYMNLLHHRNTVSSLVVAKTPRQDCLISGSFDGTIAVWDVTRTRAFQPVPEYTLLVSDEEVLAVAFHPQLGAIFTAGNDGLICMWNAESRARVAVFRGHKNAVGCLALDGNFLISGSDDASIIVWNIQPAFPVAHLRGHELAVRDLIVLPRVGLIASCSFDGRVIVWDYQRAAPAALAQDDAAAAAAAEEELRRKDAEAKAKASAKKAKSTPPAPAPAPSSAQPQPQSLWLDTGMGAAVHQFHHGDKRFRCLLYDEEQGKIFAGTEEARIMFFILPDNLVPPHLRRKDRAERERAQQEAQRTPRARRARRTQQQPQQQQAQESKEDLFPDAASASASVAAAAASTAAASLSPALAPVASAHAPRSGMGAAAASALGDSIAALSLGQAHPSSAALAAPGAGAASAASSARAGGRSLAASSHTSSTATLLPGGGVGLLLPDGSVPPSRTDAASTPSRSKDGSKAASAAATPRGGGGAPAAPAFSSVVNPDVYVDFSGIVRELTARSSDIQELLATVKPLPVRPPPPPTLAAVLANTAAAAAAAAAGEDARGGGGGAMRGSATYFKGSAVGGGSAAAAALKRMSFAPSVAAPSQARRASLNSGPNTQALSGVAALLKANAAAAATASATAETEEKDGGAALAASMLINPRTSSSSSSSSSSPSASTLASPSSAAGSSGGGSSKFASARPSARPSARASARGSLVRDINAAASAVEAPTPPRQGGLLSPSASLSTLMVPGQSTAPAAVASAPAESSAVAAARARSQRRSSVSSGQVSAALAAAATIAAVSDSPHADPTDAVVPALETPAVAAAASSDSSSAPRASIVAGDPNAPIPELQASNRVQRFSMPSNKGRLQFDL